MELVPRNAIILARLSGLRGDDERGIEGQVRLGYDYARLGHRAAAEPRGDREQRDRGVLGDCHRTLGSGLRLDADNSFRPSGAGD